MNSSIAEIVFLVFIGLVTENVSGALHKGVSLLRVWFDREYQRQIGRILGTWEDVTEAFTDSGTENTYVMNLRASGARITGETICKTGPDAGKIFSLEGSFRDLILRLTWVPTAHAEHSPESGALALKFTNEGTLEGYDLYIEPGDGKVHASKFLARRR